MIWGYFKKLVLADTLAPCVHAVFENYAQYSGPAVLTGVFFYSIQIYADFSGYMDIMCGLCQVLDIRLEENFLRPYFSKSTSPWGHGSKATFTTLSPSPSGTRAWVNGPADVSARPSVRLCPRLSP